MSSAAASFAAEPFGAGLPEVDRLAVLFAELSELCGQRNAIDSRVVEIVAEMDHDRLCGSTGAKSIAQLVAWKTGTSLRNAHTIAAIAHRLDQFPRCTDAMRQGTLSLDQVGVIAEGAADGSDAHYAQLAAVATVAQLRTAIKLEPQPDPEPRPEPQRCITKTPGPGEQYTTWHIRLPKVDAAKFDTALQSHHDALIAAWRHDHDSGDGDGEDHGGRQDDVQVPPFPNGVDAFMSLIEAGWDTETAARPHGQHTTVVVHVDTQTQVAALHLGPLLTDDERAYLTCDATCEVWFQREGRVIGAGRTTRTVNRRLRRALEHRDQCCVVPGCAATRGLHAHHIVHWRNGGLTELSNLVLVCPYHHRLHHRRVITITGPAHRLLITDDQDRPLGHGSLARPPTKPKPTVPPYPGPTGERADWWWYQPFEPPPPPTEV
jgi:hypothetical protein